MIASVNGSPAKGPGPAGRQQSSVRAAGPIVAAIAALLLLSCQAHPPVPVEIVSFDPALTEEWIVENGPGIIPRGTILRLSPTEVPSAQGRLNPPLARLGVSGQGHSLEDRPAYHITAVGDLTPREFDAYLVELNGRELMGLPLLNDQRNQAGLAGKALTLQQLALLGREGDTIRLRFPRRLLAWMPWISFPSNTRDASENYRPLARREGITESFSHLLDLYRAHMDEPGFWGDPTTLRRRPAP